MHEPVREFEVVQDFPGRVDLKIPRRQRGKMRVQFVFADDCRRQFAHFLHEQFASVSEARRNSVPPVSSVIARSCNCQSSESLKPFQSLSLVPCESANVSNVSRFKRFGRLDLPRKIADDRRVVKVAPLRQAGHQQMVFDDEPQGVRRRAVELQTLGRAHGHVRADRRRGRLFCAARPCRHRAAAARGKAGRAGSSLETAARNFYRAAPAPPRCGRVVRGRPACVRRRRIDGKIRAAPGR